MLLVYYFKLSHGVCFSFQRYYYYVEKGIHKSMIAPQDPVVMKNVANLIPNHLLNNHDLHYMIDDLSEEVNHDYEYSIRKSIGKCFS